MSSEFITLYTRVKKEMSNVESQKAFMKSFSETYSSNYEILTSSGLYKRPIVSNTPLEKLTGLSDSDYQNAMSQSSDMSKVASSFKTESFYLRIILATRYCLEVKNEDLLKSVLAYTVLKLYSVLYVKYFKFGSANEDVMNYTISSLTNKYDLKKEGSLIGALSKLSLAALENYKDRILMKDDNSMFEYIEGFRTRVNAFIQNIYDVFKTNMTHGLTMKTSRSSATNKEGEEFSIELDTRSNVIAQASENFVLYFISSPISKKSLRVTTAIETLVSEANLIKVIEVMKGNPERVGSIMSGMIGELMENTKKAELGETVCSNNFVAFAIGVFNKVSSNNSNIIAIRSNISYYITQTFPEAKESVLLRYRKAVLLYLAFNLQEQRCGK